MARQFTLHSDLGTRLLFAGMDAEERLGELFSFRLTALGTDRSLDLQALLGTSMAVHMRMEDGYERWFHGMVMDAAQDGFTTVDDISHAVYRLSLVPRAWLATQRGGCRIFSGQTVPEIVRAVLLDAGCSDVSLRLSGSYPAREYCVQYREDDFNFASRLMQQEGIYYYFSHDRQTHTMVLADGIGAHAAVRGFEKLPLLPPGQSRNQLPGTVADWRPAGSVHATGARLDDYDPLRPRASLAVAASAAQGPPLHGIDGLEGFDYPGLYTLTSDGERYAQARVDARNVERARSTACSTAYGMATGALFRLTDSPDGCWDDEYLVVSTRIRLRAAAWASGDDAGEPPFACSLEAIGSGLQFRSPATARRPVIAGLQTAVVTMMDGSEGSDEEISVDKEGRVRVLFHWNRGDDDRACSCPVRVASSWAGKSWGAVHLPRVGHEVVVSFLEGDPDRPLIIGSVYNATHVQPWDLPAERTRSGFRSHSDGGGKGDFNEIRFDDRKDGEELYVRAQKDMRGEVVNDRSATVGNDDTLEVKANGTTEVGKKFKLDAGDEIELVTGQSSIVMKKSGEIQIKGMNITITGSQSVKVEGKVEVGLKAGVKMELKSDAMLKAQGGAMATVQAPMLTLKADGIAQLNGALVKIN